MIDPLAYHVARARVRELERIVNRPDRLMGEELRLSGRSGRRRRSGCGAADADAELTNVP